MSDYAAFLAAKALTVAPVGFEPTDYTAPLFPFQQACLEWACRMGRAALFLDTGLGKTAIQLEWARQVCEHTGGRVLILAPLAVSHQTVREAAKFGVEGVAYAPDATTAARIVVTQETVRQALAAWHAERRQAERELTDDHIHADRARVGLGAQDGLLQVEKGALVVDVLAHLGSGGEGDSGWGRVWV